MRRALPLVGALTLLAACADDRGTASTEVENELQAARLSVVAEGPNSFAESPWTLLGADGDTIATGSTDSTGAIDAVVGIPVPHTVLLLHVHGVPDTVRVALFPRAGFSAGDTLSASANLLTESVLRAADPRAMDRLRFERLGDSVVRDMGGLSLPYDRIAGHPRTRDRSAQVLLEVLSIQARRSATTASRYIDDLRQDPRRSILLDTAFSRDLSAGMRHLALPPDSQTIVAIQLDSLGARGGDLYRDWEASRFLEDSALFAGLLPWIAGESASNLRNDLLLRADRLGHDAARSFDGGGSAFPVERQMRTVRRAVIRLWVHLLGDLSEAPGDSAKTAALEQLLKPAETSIRDAWKRMRLEAWTEKDSSAASFLRSAIDARRDTTWRTTSLLVSPDPFSYSLSRWPMPLGSKLDTLLDSLAATGRWGDPSGLLRPAFRSSPAP